jgi:ATPase family AAA domain-containing protein 1-A
MTSNELTRAEVASILLRTAALGIVAYYSIKWALDALDPTRKQKKRLTDLVS